MNRGALNERGDRSVDNRSEGWRGLLLSGFSCWMRSRLRTNQHLRRILCAIRRILRWVRSGWRRDRRRGGIQCVLHGGRQRRLALGLCWIGLPTGSCLCIGAGRSRDPQKIRTRTHREDVEKRRTRRLTARSMRRRCIGGRGGFGRNSHARLVARALPANGPRPAPRMLPQGSHSMTDSRRRGFAGAQDNRQSRQALPYEVGKLCLVRLDCDKFSSSNPASQTACLRERRTSWQLSRRNVFVFVSSISQIMGARSLV